MKRIESLTALRAFAAGALVYYHQQGVFIPVTYNGAFALGVSFFFVLSGFILFLNYGEAPRVGRFLLARFARLYPVHLVTFVLFGLAFAPDIFFNEDYRWPLFANVLLVHSWIPTYGYVYSMNPVSWSISVEFFFYLAFPLLCRVRNLAPVLVVSLVAAIAALLIAQRYDPNVADMSGTPWIYSPMELALHSPVMRIAEFTAGIWFAKLFRSGRFAAFITFFATPIELACVAGVLLYGAFSMKLAFAFIAMDQPLIGSWLQNSSGMFVFGALILVIAHQGGAVSRFLQSRFLVLMGETSFSLYMLHVIVIMYMSQNHLLADHPWWLRVITATSVAYVGSYLLWRLVEVPARKLILWRPRVRKPDYITALPIAAEAARRN